MLVFFAFMFLLSLTVASPVWEVSPVYPVTLPQTPFGVDDIGVGIFTTFVLPFEVISLVLLAAMIGAIYIAKKEVSG
ncbi:MAG: dehydrogenase [Euryarchaeota archaeon]|nr:dehydrogenase [Euryarchaeota archaeon]